MSYKQGLHTIDKDISRSDPLWYVQVTVAAALLLQLVLPDKFVAGPKYFIIAIEVLFLLSLIFTTPKRGIINSVRRRVNSVALIALISIGNILALQRVAHYLLIGGHISNGHQLILASVNIYLTNIIIFGLWYWEIDGGGPGIRAKKSVKEHDFLFPQMATPEIAAKGWTPVFFDYLYVSATNATAFSPTDTMPLTVRVKLLMLVQATVSLITLALVAARAVNILG